MAKKVFFSFHYQDVIDFRANVVRKHGSFKLSSQDAGFYDSSMWEKAKTSKTGSCNILPTIPKKQPTFSNR